MTSVLLLRAISEEERFWNQVIGHKYLNREVDCGAHKVKHSNSDSIHAQVPFRD